LQTDVNTSPRQAVTHGAGQGLALTGPAAGPFRLALIGAVAVFGAWVLFAAFMVPWLLTSIYNGSTFSFLGNVVMRHRVEHGVALESYLQDWRYLSRQLTVSMALFGSLGLVLVKGLDTRTFFERFVGRARPGVVGAIRMWTCGILMVSISCERMGTIALLPPELRQPLGLMMLLDWMPIGFDRFVQNAPALWAFQALTIGLLFLGMIGYWTRLVVPLALVCAYIVNGILREYSFFWHQNLVPIYVLAVLSFTRCGDGWSVDRLIRIYRGKPVPEAGRAVAVYGWARYACWVPISLLYFWSGLSKLRQSGLMWVNPINMRNILYEESLSGKWYPLGMSLYLEWAPDFVFVLLGVVALAAELSYPLVLFSKTARRIIPLMTIGLHLGIIFMQDIVFLDLIALNLILMDFTWLRDRLVRRFSRNGPLAVLYDGSCKYCRATVRVLAAMDLFGRLEVVDFRRLDLQAFNRAHGSDLQLDRLEKEMAVVSRGRVSWGFFAYRALSGALPALWIAAPLLRVPGASRLGAWVYRNVAVRRPRCIEACATEPAAAPAAFASELTTMQRFGYVLSIAALTVVMSVAFHYRIEFYPFTAMQLFTGLQGSTVTYFRVMGTRQSGERTRVRLEDGIAALRFNQRYRIAAYEHCFGQPAEKDVCRKFLSATMAVYNQKSAPRDRFTSLEVNKWLWDFRSSPDDPMRGRIAERYVFTP
jgi:predicted DCC family thiol-disulfide oxidoreductase YuxK